MGFRPFIYRLAKKYKLNGNVSNRTDGVIVNISGEEQNIENFKLDVLKLAPAAATIKSLNSIFIDDFKSREFKILPSVSVENQITEISPDIAVCNDCLQDLKNQDHRINYPFINCTHCGPRFSIIKSLPYDRIKTTMHEFEMCKVCNNEYLDVNDRRFHAQPVACNNCGPRYSNGSENNFEIIIQDLAQKINSGKIVAVKGLGGYNLICDAQNETAVKSLREIKNRDGKPFAAMFRDLYTVEEFCHFSSKEQELLKSWQRPIVVLTQRKELCNTINKGLNSIGAMLPYLPFHYILFEKLSIPAIVYTSANSSGEPIISDDDFAENNLSSKVDLFISHNRKIENPLDDSVVKIAYNKPQFIRRARGYVPTPICMNKNVEGIFAAGAELKNTFCIGKNNSAILSQYIGDLKNFETYEFYHKTVNQFFDLFKFIPKVIACDLHPEYLSTKFAEKLNENNLNGNRIPIVKVQHHHAHIASCMAEYQINEKVIGVSFDGTGYGTDGNIWGGEFLICDTKSFDRYAHFNNVKMPGGDLAIDQPWRMVLSYLLNKNHQIKNLKCFHNISEDEIDLVNTMIEKNINSPLTSSAGRLFDAVACILNLCSQQSFEAEGPMRLEDIVSRTEHRFYPFDIQNNIIMFDRTLDALIDDLNIESIDNISSKFHNTIAQVVNTIAVKIRKEKGLNKIILSGGVFQNRFLLEKTIQVLSEYKFRIYTNRSVPPNDGGIALGQLIVASNNM